MISRACPCHSGPSACAPAGQPYLLLLSRLSSPCHSPPPPRRLGSARLAQLLSPRKGPLASLAPALVSDSRGPASRAPASPSEPHCALACSLLRRSAAPCLAHRRHSSAQPRPLGPGSPCPLASAGPRRPFPTHTGSHSPQPGLEAAAIATHPSGPCSGSHASFGSGPVTLLAPRPHGTPALPDRPRARLLAARTRLPCPAGLLSPKPSDARTHASSSLPALTSPGSARSGR